MQLELGSTPAASPLWAIFKNNDAADDVREKVSPGFGFWSINGGSHTCVSPLRFTRYKAPGRTTPGSRNTTTDCPIRLSLFQVFFLSLLALWIHWFFSSRAKCPNFHFSPRGTKCFSERLRRGDMLGSRLLYWLSLSSSIWLLTAKL